MRFCTRAQLLGGFAILAFMTTSVYSAHSAWAQEQSATASAQSERNGQTPHGDVADKGAPDRLEQFLRLIKQETTFDFFETPLVEVASEVSERHEVNVIIDEKALEDLAIDKSEPITIEIGGVSLGTALDMLLRQHDLDYGFQENVLIISTMEVLETQLTTRVYDVRDMLNAKQPWRSLDVLTEVIVGSIEPDSWEELGGNGAIHVYQGNLVVSQTWRQHRELICLLKALRKNIQAMGGPKMPLPPEAVENSQADSAGGFGGGGFFQVEDSAERRDLTTDAEDAPLAVNQILNPFDESNRDHDGAQDKARDSVNTASHVRIEQKEPKEINLQRRITLDFKRIPLREAMDQISAQCGFGWLVEKQALEDIAVDTTDLITFHANNVSLETALNMMLREAGLSYLVVDGSLTLTTEESVAAELITRYYNARPLLNSQYPDDSLDRLIELLTATVAPDTWDELGGAGTVGQYEGILIISNTRFVHAKVDSFLKELSDALAQAGGVELVKPHTSDRSSFGRDRGRNRR